MYHISHFLFVIQVLFKSCAGAKRSFIKLAGEVANEEVRRFGPKTALKEVVTNETVRNFRWDDELAEFKNTSPLINEVISASLTSR